MKQKKKYKGFKGSGMNPNKISKHIREIEREGRAMARAICQGLGIRPYL